MRAASPAALPRALFSFLLLAATLNFCLQRQGTYGQTLPQEEVQALKQIASKLKIPATLWKFDVDPCTQWTKEDRDPYVHNVTCEEFSTITTNATTKTTVWHVVRIDIKAANLTGVLPEEFGRLSHLSWIDLSRNYINGSIPAANWTSLPLKNLNLLANRISGAIPEEIGSIGTLEILFLESNMMQGPLPHSLGSLTNLSRLFLSGNNFSGELPETLSNLKNLIDVLDGTEISGKIPSFTGNWTKLERLDMQGTFMEGPFPPELSFLQSLTELRVSDLKNPGGSFPPLEKMLNMQQLVLRNCSISGIIPDYIGKFTKLQSLDLSFNNFTGEIPENFVNLRSLETMYLTGNKLTGSIPDWIKRTTKNIDISYNTFTNLSSAPANCQQESQNYVASFSSTTSDSIASCLRKDLPCNVRAKNYNLFINCGGESVTVDGNEYEPDLSLEGTSKYYLSSSGKWAYSSTGNFIGGRQQRFLVENESTLTMPNAEFLGRRVFDVSVQGKKVLRDFNIAEAANGTGKEVIMNFIAPVEGGTLEIHFVWSGKGTNSIPYTGVYGPLISAISVTPNFTPRLFRAKKFPVGIIIGVVASIVSLILGIFCHIWFCLRREANENGGM